MTHDDTDRTLRTNLEHIRFHPQPEKPRTPTKCSTYSHTTPTMQSAFLAAVLCLLSVTSIDAFVPGATGLPARTSAARCGAGELTYFYSICPVAWRGHTGLKKGKRCASITFLRMLLGS